MEILTDLEPFFEPCAVALGLFDGVHLGHREVICRAVDNTEDLLPVVLTFSIGHEKPAKKVGMKTILSDGMKCRRFEELGVKRVLMPKFEDLRTFTADAFVEDILYKRLHARMVVCGYDFRFGRGASGDAAYLQQKGEELGMHVIVVPPYLSDGKPVSSTSIRTLLSDGRIEDANRLLGERYRFDFTVIRGKQLGRMIGSPTINQEFPSDFLVPKFGVYASCAKVKGEEYCAITNIGVKPTIEGHRRPLAETYIIGLDMDLYGQNVEVGLVSFLRSEQKFPDIDTLTQAIQRDVQKAQEILRQTDAVC